MTPFSRSTFAICLPSLIEGLSGKTIPALAAEVISRFLAFVLHAVLSVRLRWEHVQGLIQVDLNIFLPLYS